MRNFILLLLLLSSATIFSQVNFQNGYFIYNNNQKVDCLIKNKDWNRLPDSFEYKLNKNDKVQTVSMLQIKEFRILDTDLFYVKEKLTQDIKNDNYQVIKHEGEDVFFKVLLRGEGSVYEYFNERSYFFYELDNQGLVLLPKPNKNDKENKKKNSNVYKNDLYSNLKCDGITLADFKKLHYREQELIKLFSKYNTCKGGGSENIFDKRTKTLLRLKAIAGLNFHNSITNKLSFKYSFSLPPSAGGGTGTSTGKDEIKFDGQTNFFFGGELELVLPINNNKWSIFISPIYQSFSDLSGSKEVKDHELNYDADYDVNISSISFIELPIGVRYYMKFNEKTQIFTHLAIASNIIVSADYTQEINNHSNHPFKFAENEKNYSFYSGVGLNYDKFAIGLNYYFTKNLRDSKNLNLNANGAISLFGSYTIF